MAKGGGKKGPLTQSYGNDVDVLVVIKMMNTHKSEDDGDGRGLTRFFLSSTLFTTIYLSSTPRLCVLLTSILLVAVLAVNVSTEAEEEIEERATAEAVSPPRQPPMAKSSRRRHLLC